MSRILVTGAGGFIGRRVLESLAAAGHDVHAVGRRPGEAPGVTWHAADLTREAPAVVHAAAPEILVHLAWYTEHGRFWAAPENVIWVESSLALLRAFAERGGRRAVVAGTCAEYDWTTAAQVLAEDAPIAPATLYGAAKAGLQEVASAYAGQAGFQLAWGRVFFPYGADEDEGRLVTSVARALLAGEIAKTTAGTQVRDFIHVDDVAGAFAALAQSDVCGPVNIGSGVPVTVREVIDEIASAAGNPENVDSGAIPQREGEPEHIVAGVRRLRDEVGFRPRYDLPTGIAQTVAALRGEG